MDNLLTIVPIRKGSTGVKGKNTRLLAGEPLVAHVLRAAKSARLVSKLVVSTDCPRYAEIAEDLGAEVPFLRPVELANNTAPLYEVAAHALHYYDSCGVEFDAVLSLQATVPLIKPSTIDGLITKWQRNSCMSAGTISEIRHGHPYIAKALEGRNGDIAVDFLNLPPSTTRYPRAKRPRLFFFNGAAFIRHRGLLDNPEITTNCMGDQPQTFLMDDMESINIDEEFDFFLAEQIMLQR